MEGEELKRDRHGSSPDLWRFPMLLDDIQRDISALPAQVKNCAHHCYKNTLKSAASEVQPFDFEAKIVCCYIDNRAIGGKALSISNMPLKPYPPVAIGAVGGSGTRLIAQILEKLGFYIGSDLNEATDNLWFTLLFKRIEILSVSDDEFEELVDIFVHGMMGSKKFLKSKKKAINNLASMDRTQHTAAWLKGRTKSLLSKQHTPVPIEAWGWKEPNTHIVIDRLQRCLPEMKYIHVVRNGLDMAHSANQNQLHLWGTHFIDTTCQDSPRYSLKYWHIVHQRVLDLCRPMGPRFLFLNFDQLCLDTINGIKRLLEFLEVNVSESQIRDLSNLVRVPETVGRFKQHRLQIFDPEDVSFVRRLGFDTSLE